MEVCPSRMPTWLGVMVCQRPLLWAKMTSLSCERAIATRSVIGFDGSCTRSFSTVPRVKQFPSTLVSFLGSITVFMRARPACSISGSMKFSSCCNVDGETVPVLLLISKSCSAVLCSCSFSCIISKSFWLRWFGVRTRRAHSLPGQSSVALLS